MVLYFVYAEEESFKKWLRKLIGNKSDEWQYNPGDDRYLITIEFEYYDQINHKFVPGIEYKKEARKQFHYSIDPYPEYPSYYFYAQFVEFDVGLSGKEALKIPKKEDEDIGFLEIINLGDGRIQLKIDIDNENMIFIRDDLLQEIKKIWKHKFIEDEFVLETKPEESSNKVTAKNQASSLEEIINEKLDPPSNKELITQENEELIEEEKIGYPEWIDIALEIYLRDKSYDQVRFELTKVGIHKKTKTIRNRFSELRESKNIPSRNEIKKRR